MPRPTDGKAARKAALAFEREEKRGESEQGKRGSGEGEGARAASRQVAKVQSRKPRGSMIRVPSTIEAECAAIEKRSEAEEARWEKQKEKLEAAARRARE